MLRRHFFAFASTVELVHLVSLAKIILDNQNIVKSIDGKFFDRRLEKVAAKLMGRIQRIQAEFIGQQNIADIVGARGFIDE